MVARTASANQRGAKLEHQRPAAAELEHLVAALGELVLMAA